MTLVCLQYPPVFILFITAAIMVLAATMLKTCLLITALLSGVTAVTMLLVGLFYAVPLTELLAMLLVLVLLCSFAFSREGDT